MEKEEYEKIKADMLKEREEMEKEKKSREAEFRRMREEEIVTIGQVRLNIASRVAATLAANMAIEASAVCQRAFGIADAMIKHIEDEIDGTS